MTNLRDHLKIRSTMDPGTGKTYTVYFYKRKRCLVQPIPGHVAKQYIGYHLIREDLRDADNWMGLAYDMLPPKKKQSKKTANDDHRLFEATLDKKADAIIKSLFFSSVIAYGKCFTQAKGRGVKLEAPIVSDALRDMHDKIMNWRHTLAAHSGEGSWERGAAILILPPKIGSNVDFHILPHLTRLVCNNDRDDETNFSGLIKCVKGAVDEKCNKLTKKIVNEIVKPKGEKYWYKTAKEYE